MFTLPQSSCTEVKSVWPYFQYLGCFLWGEKEEKQCEKGVFSWENTLGYKKMKFLIQVLGQCYFTEDTIALNRVYKYGCAAAWELLLLWHCKDTHLSLWFKSIWELDSTLGLWTKNQLSEKLKSGLSLNPSSLQFVWNLELTFVCFIYSGDK